MGGWVGGWVGGWMGSRDTSLRDLCILFLPTYNCFLKLFSLPNLNCENLEMHLLSSAHLLY
jgi:hypothetical protein